MKIISWQRLKGVVSTVLLAIGLTSLTTQAAQAQFTSPPGQGVPKGTAGGGSRKPFCLLPPNNRENLLALAPTQFIGLTSRENLSIWVYVPNTTAKTLEFSLLTQDREGIYQTQVPVSAPGLLKITLPKVVTLAIGKPYYWTAALICDPKQRTNDWWVDGWIQQQPISTDLQRQLAGAPIEQQVKLYAQTKFWYEALDVYLDLQQTQPSHPSLSRLWADLIRTAGLGNIPLQGKLPQISKPTLSTQAHR